MRRVTVRVSEGDDWSFQAERADGSLLFAVEFTADAAPAQPAADAPPRNNPPAAADLPFHLGDFGMMLGSPNPEHDQVLYDLRDVVDLALDGRDDVQTVEIGAGSGETTIAYMRPEMRGSLWLVDPQLSCCQDPSTAAQQCLKANLSKLHGCQVADDNAINAAKKLQKQDLSLLLITPQLERQQQTALLNVWLPHMRPDGRVVLRMPADRIPLAIKGMEVYTAGEWLLYTPEAQEVPSGDPV